MDTNHRIPRVYWARLLLKEIVDRNGITEYKHSNSPVTWNPYESITNCSGFVNVLLKKSYNIFFGLVISSTLCFNLLSSN